jgi:hypothetical protein
MLERFVKSALLAAAMALAMLAGLGALAMFNDPELGLGQVLRGYTTNPVIWFIVTAFVGGGGLIGMLQKPEDTPASREG